MTADRVFQNAEAFAAALRLLRAQRRRQVVSGRNERIPRAVLTSPERRQILAKTNGRCHICGGMIDGYDWQADHILAHSTGGKHSVDNYLPAHSLCNNYRWHYDAEEFQWILKIGVWMRTQIEKGTAIGREASQRFCKHEQRRSVRRKRQVLN
jgi:hypothetical protein